MSKYLTKQRRQNIQLEDAGSEHSIAVMVSESVRNQVLGLCKANCSKYMYKSLIKTVERIYDYADTAREEQWAEAEYLEQLASQIENTLLEKGNLWKK